MHSGRNVHTATAARQTQGAQNQHRPYVYKYTTYMYLCMLTGAAYFLNGEICDGESNKEMKNVRLYDANIGKVFSKLEMNFD